MRLALVVIGGAVLCSMAALARTPRVGGTGGTFGDTPHPVADAESLAPASDAKLDAIAVKHDAAVAHAAEVYWRVVLAADDQQLADYNRIARTVNVAENPQLGQRIQAAQAQRARNADDAKQPLTPASDLVRQLAAAASAARTEKFLEAAGPTIAQAIKEHRLLVGMTMAQARLAMEGDGQLVASSGGADTYQWTNSSISGMTLGGYVGSTTMWQAAFRNGKIEGFEKLNMGSGALGAPAVELGPHGGIAH